MNLESLLCREFLLYLSVTEATEYNNHFSPYFLHCSPCIANFSSVVKIDSPQYNAEENYLLQKTGLLELVQPEKRNQGKDILKIYDKNLILLYFLRFKNQETLLRIFCQSPVPNTNEIT